MLSFSVPSSSPGVGVENIDARDQCVYRVVTTSTRRLTLTPNTAFTLYKVNPGLIPGAETPPSQMYGYLSAFRSSLHPLIFHSIAFRIHIAIHSGPGFSPALYALLCHTHSHRNSLRPRLLTGVVRPLVPHAFTQAPASHRRFIRPPSRVNSIILRPYIVEEVVV